MIKKFEFWLPRFGGDPRFGAPKFRLNFIFPLYLLKNFMCLVLKVKKFEFWRARLAKNPHRGTPNFC